MLNRVLRARALLAVALSAALALAACGAADRGGGSSSGDAGAFGASRSGTFARAERPSVPVSTAVTVLPASAWDGSVETRRPMRDGTGCE